jgi:hypothetical protein
MLKRYCTNVTEIRVERASRRTEVRSLLIAALRLDRCRTTKTQLFPLGYHILLVTLRDRRMVVPKSQKNPERRDR